MDKVRETYMIARHLAPSGWGRNKIAKARLLGATQRKIGQSQRHNNSEMQWYSIGKMGVRVEITCQGFYSIK